MKDYFGNEIDENGVIKKKNTTALPSRDANGQSKVKLSSEALNTPDPISMDQNNQILKKAQDVALGQSMEPSELQNKVTQKATEYVDNPMNGFDPDKQKQAQLEQFDMDWSKGLEGLRRQYGSASGSGLIQDEMLRNTLQRNVDKQTLESAIDTDNLNRYMAAMQGSINAGNAVNQSNEAIFAQRIGNLANVRNMAEGERSQAQAYEYSKALQDRGYDKEAQLQAQQHGFNLELMDIQYGQDISKMILNQNWEGAQNDLDRQMAFALQQNDQNMQREIQAKQNAFQLDYLYANQQWESMENELNRQLNLAMQANDALLQHELMDKSYTYEFNMLSTELNWQAEENRIQRNLQLAMQQNDIAATAANLQKQLAMDEWKTRYTTQANAQENALNRALSYSLAEMDRATQLDSIALKGQVDSQLLSQQQDWQGVQNAIDRQLSLTMQNNQNNWQSGENSLDRNLTYDMQTRDINAQQQLVVLKGQVDMAAQLAEQKFQEAQRIATQNWQTNERMSTQDWQTAVQYNEYKYNSALQQQDFEGQAYIQKMNNDLALTMQTADFNYNEKMAYLSSMLNEAKANNDVVRQSQLIEYQTNAEIRTMQESYGYEAASQAMQYKYEMAMQQNDQVAAQTLQRMNLEYQAIENEKNRQLQEIELKFQQNGIDLAAKEQEWAMLKDAVTGYAADKSSLVDYLNNTISQANITIKAPDPVDVYKQANLELEGMKSEYLYTHPEYRADNGTMTQEGQDAFNKHYNATIWDEGTTNTYQPFTTNDFSRVTGETKGANSVYVDPGLRDQLNYALDKETTFVDATTGKAVTGTLSKWYETPNTIQANILDTKTNKMVTIPIWWNDERSYV